MNFDKFFEPEIIVFLIPICAIMIPIVAIIAGFWSKVAKVNSDNELKRDMLDRGMSAEDIERVLNAGTNKDSKDE